MTPTVEDNPTTTKRLIPLDLLDLAPENPRKEPDPSAIAELAESIASQGLLQNLVVYWDGERARVVAGGRRLRALKKLAEEGRLPEDLERGVPCEVIPKERAFEVAIVENLQREEVPPLEEAEAFAELQQKGFSLKEIALRVDKSEKLVRERLALARNLVPEVKALLKNGKITLTTAVQIAKLPAEVQVDLAGRYLIDPAAAQAYLESYLKQEGVPQSVIVFPLERYLEEGGEIVEGLFGEEPVLTNRPLVARLQEAAAEEIANRFKDQGQDVVLFKGGFDAAKWRPANEGETGRTLVIFDPSTLKVEVHPNQVEAEKAPAAKVEPAPTLTNAAATAPSKLPATPAKVEIRDEADEARVPKRVQDEYLDVLAEVGAKRIEAGGARMAKAAVLLALHNNRVWSPLRLRTQGTQRYYPNEQERKLWDQADRYETVHKRVREVIEGADDPLEALLALDPEELERLFTLTVASLAEPDLADRRPRVGEVDEMFFKGFALPLLRKALVELEGQKARMPKKKGELIQATQKHEDKPLPTVLARAADSARVPKRLQVEKGGE